mmetsp:Transcript_44127/g.74332  ORF Transcript_44127/g.74332 Transcript_44127/m.74332 type:complete len:80 (+) Transcript_44127:700-939(+)
MGNLCTQTPAAALSCMQQHSIAISSHLQKASPPRAAVILQVRPQGLECMIDSVQPGLLVNPRCQNPNPETMNQSTMEQQ